MRRLGKLSGAVLLGCLLCMALCSTGAFAQSASYNTANNAAQSVTTHVWQGANAVARSQGVVRSNGWGRGWGRGWSGNSFGYRHSRFDRFIRVTRMIRVTEIIRVTQVRIIHVTRWIRTTQLRRVSSCGGGC
jgi:hypothetical protein